MNFYDRMKTALTLVLLFSYVLLSGCDAVHFPTLEEGLVRLTTQFPSLWKLATGAAYLIGMIFIFRAVYQLKVYGDLRTMMSTQTNFKSTMVLFIVGTALMYLPTAFKVMLYSSFGTTSPDDIMSYQSGSSSDMATNAVLHVVQFIGLISFIRGWIQLTKSSNAGGHDSFSKAVTHILGGVFAINIGGLKHMFEATFGAS